MKTDLTPHDLAVDLMRRSTCKVQMSAVLSDKNGRIFSWGWNSGFIHAEQLAIRRANPKRLRGSTITIVGKRRKNGNSVFAAPCVEKCLPLIMAMGISRIVYRDGEEYLRIVSHTPRP